MLATSSPWRDALRLTWPATLALLLQSGYRVNDQYWIGPLGADAQAAVGITGFQLILNFALIVIFQSGPLARIAFHTGAGDLHARREVFEITLRRGVLWFVLVAAFGWWTTPDIVDLLGARGEVAELAKTYLRVLYIGMPLMALKPFTDGVFLGIGDTRSPMVFAGLSVGLNFALNPLLIYGYWGMPALGIAGAAWATILSRGLAGALGMWVLARRDGLAPRWWFSGRASALARREFWHSVRIGLPVCLTNAAYAISSMLVLKTSIEAFGRDVQAGLGVAFNGVEAVSYCTMMGPAIACSSLVGRSLGARDGKRAAASIRACMTMSVGLAGIASLLFWLTPEALVAAYTSDPGVRDQAVLYLAVAAWSQTATAADGVLQQALAGAGRSLAMSLTTTAGLAMRIPLAFWLAHSMEFGPAGVWWAFNVSNWLKLGAIILVFWRASIWRLPTPVKNDGQASAD